MLPSGNKNRSPLTDVAGFVRKTRKSNRLSQTELALLAGVGRRFVSELENAKPTLQVGMVDRVLRVLGKRLGILEIERPSTVHESTGRSSRTKLDAEEPSGG
jgi:transcriptional regulator with XRE-family HTH domain